MRSSLPLFFAFLAAAVTSTVAAPMPADSLQQIEARDIDAIVNYLRRSIGLDDSLSTIVKRSILDELDRRQEYVDELQTRNDDSELLATREHPDSDDSPEGGAKNERKKKGKGRRSKKKNHATQEEDRESLSTREPLDSNDIRKDGERKKTGHMHKHTHSDDVRGGGKRRKRHPRKSVPSTHRDKDELRTRMTEDGEQLVTRQADTSDMADPTDPSQNAAQVPPTGPSSKLHSKIHKVKKWIQGNLNN